MKNGIEDFTRELTCTYKGEMYSVRDNGEVYGAWSEIAGRNR